MPDAAEKKALLKEFGPSAEGLPEHPNVLNFLAGYRAGLEASPSEEEVLNAAWQIGQNHYWTLGGHHDGKWLDLRGYAALAALRTTKEGKNG